MQTTVRPELDFVRTGPASYVLHSPVSGESYELGDDERFLLQLLNAGYSDDEVRIAFDARFGRSLSKRRLKEFVASVEQSGLLAEPQMQASAPAELQPSDQEEIVESPRGESARFLNACFDVLDDVFGPLVHPAMLAPGLLAALLAGVVVYQHFDRLLFDLEQMTATLPVPLVLLLLVVKLCCRDLPREMMVGIACRRYRGRIKAFELRFLHRLLPYIQCDVGDSFYFMEERGQWTLLLVRVLSQIAIASAALLCWAMTSPGSGFGWLCLILAVPSLVGMVASLNVFAEADAYYVLSYELEIEELFERARAQFRAFATFRYPPEPLPLDKRLWYRLYGFSTYVWDWGFYAAVVALGGWWLIANYNGVGAVLGLVLWAWWHHEDIWRLLSENRVFRWLIIGGDHMWLTWTVRLALAAGVVAIGFIPYHYEIVGDCRVIPAVERGVRAQVTDEITTINVSEGDLVEADQVIAEMSGRDVIRELETTKAQLNQADAELELLLAGARDEEIAMAEYQVQLWQTRFEFAENELARTAVLAKRESATEKDVESARRSRDVVRDLLSSSQANLKKVREGAREQEIRKQKEKINELRTHLDYYSQQEQLLTVKSPIAGRISTMNLPKRVGQVAQKGELVAVVQDVSTLRVEMAADEASSANVRPGMPVKIRLNGEDGRLRMGRVLSVGVATTTVHEFDVPRVDSDREIRLEKTNDRNQPDDYVVRVIVNLDKTPRELIPGMTGYARIVVDEDILLLATFRHIVRFFRTEVWSWLP